MIKYENDCCDCDIPCNNCGRKETPHYYCDECGSESELYQYYEHEFCFNCLHEQFIKNVEDIVNDLFDVICKEYDIRKIND